MIDRYPLYIQNTGLGANHNQNMVEARWRRNEIFYQNLTFVFALGGGGIKKNVKGSVVFYGTIFFPFLSMCYLRSYLLEEEEQEL